LTITVARGDDNFADYHSYHGSAAVVETSTKNNGNGQISTARG